MKEGRTKTGPIWLKGDSKIGVLLLHGWISPSDELLPLAQILNSFGYTVSAPLLSGHGTVPENLKDVTWQDWLNDSQKALLELKKHSSQIFVGGISMGGNLAMLLSRDESVAGVIAMGASVKFHFQKLAAVGLFLMGLTKTYRRAYYPPWVRKKMIERNVYSSYPISSAKEVLRLVQHTRNNLSQIKKPILILQAKNDHLVSRQSPRIISNGVKSELKEIYWIKNAYHVFVDNKKAQDKIAKFISRVIS